MEECLASVINENYKTLLLPTGPLKPFRANDNLFGVTVVRKFKFFSISTRDIPFSLAIY